MERGILFSAPMVRAILAGTKTQTRRICDPGKCPNPACWDAWQIPGDDRTFGCPYGSDENGEGEPDRLWVRETWRPRIADAGGLMPDSADVRVRYEADGAERFFDERDIPDTWTMPKAAKRGNVTPLFMPRWASRLVLEVTEVRLERLQDISESDARAEGVETILAAPGATPCYAVNAEHGPYFETAREAFFHLWESINGKMHAERVFVWCISFRRVETAVKGRAA